MCLSGRFEGSTFQFSQGYYTNLVIRSQFSGSKKKCVSAVSQLSKNSSRTHCTFPWEKRPGGCVLWVLTTIPVVTLIGETAMSDVPARSGKQLVSFRTLNYVIKVVTVIKRKMNQYIFFLHSWGCNYPDFTRGKYCFYYEAQIPRFTKTCDTFSHSQSGEKTHLG